MPARRMSWWSSTACMASVSVTSSSVAGTESRTDWEYRRKSPPRSSIHSTMGVNSISPTPPPGNSSTTTRLPAVPAVSDSAATVLRSNTSRGVIRTPADLARVTNWMDMIESPPRVKNESSTPTSSSPRTSANRLARMFSVADAGPRLTVACRPKSGSGNAFRSSFPFTVSGKPSRTVTTAGTMWGANLCETYSSNAAGEIVAPDSGTT